LKEQVQRSEDLDTCRGALKFNPQNADYVLDLFLAKNKSSTMNTDSVLEDGDLEPQKGGLI
jgi:hypothetical protein